MNNNSIRQLFLLFTILLFCSCNMGPPQGSPETGYTIHGFVGNSPTEAAPNVMVLLFDVETSKPVASDNTNLFGKYKFEHIQPGYYKVKSGKVEMELVIIDKNQRLDINLSAESGVMDYAKDAVKEMTDAVVGVTPPGKPGGDPEVAKSLMGKWYSYSGTSTISGGGGSESQLAFCPDGSYYDNYESGYYGSSSDATFGTASQEGGGGIWSVEGNAQGGVITIKLSNGNEATINFQMSDENGCLIFDGRKHCYSGDCK